MLITKTLYCKVKYFGYFYHFNGHNSRPLQGIIEPIKLDHVFIVSGWMLFNAKWAIFSYTMAGTSYISTIWWCPFCTRPTHLVGFL